MNQSLQYLSESLSNYVEEDNICQQICEKLEHENYEEEIDFIEALEEEEVIHLETILKKEINYAEGAADDVRVKKLENIYQILF